MQGLYCLCNVLPITIGSTWYRIIIIQVVPATNLFFDVLLLLITVLMKLASKILKYSTRYQYPYLLSSQRPKTSQQNSKSLSAPKEPTSVMVGGPTRYCTKNVRMYKCTALLLLYCNSTSK